MPRRVILAFDFYGTLIDPLSITVHLSTHLPNLPSCTMTQLVTDWRRYQLEYTWRLTCMQQYLPFNQVTRNSLFHALQINKVSPLPDEKIIGEILWKYQEGLGLFEDAEKMLEALPSVRRGIVKQAAGGEEKTREEGITLEYLIFSNGTPQGMEKAISANPLLTSTFIDQRSAHTGSPGTGGKGVSRIGYISVDDVKLYKPHPRTYGYLLERLDAKPSEVFLVSGNPFDVQGARNMGLRTIWVDREGKGWVDRVVGEGEGPEVIVRGLEEVVGVVEREVGKEATGGLGEREEKEKEREKWVHESEVYNVPGEEMASSESIA